VSYDSLFVYAGVFLALSFMTMQKVQHGDSRDITKKGLASFDTD
jgi:hypothetical protein